MTAPIVGILLAGGSGSRFRASGGGDKLLHPLPDGTAMAVAALRNLLAAVPRVIAVVRPDADLLAAALRSAGAEVFVCAEAVQGMGHTLAHAVREAGGAGGYVVALADMPFIRPESIRAVAQRIEAGALIAAPAFRGERGHPVGFAARLRGEFGALSGDAGARDILMRHRESVETFEVADEFVLRDLDTMDDLASDFPSAEDRSRSN